MAKHGGFSQCRQWVIHQQAAADIRMCLDDFILVIGQPARLVENGIRHGDLAQIMQETTQRDARHLVGRQSATLRKDAAVLRHAPQMPAGIGVARFHHGGHDKQAVQQMFVCVHVDPLLTHQRVLWLIAASLPCLN